MWDDYKALVPLKSLQTHAMLGQLQCHADGVPVIWFRNTFAGRNKTSWNIESWQPDGTEMDYVFAQNACNPAGSENR